MSETVTWSGLWRRDGLCVVQAGKGEWIILAGDDRPAISESGGKPLVTEQAAKLVADAAYPMALA